MARLDHRDVARTPGLGTGHRQHPRQRPSDLWEAADGQGPQTRALQDRRGGRQGRLRSAKAREEEMVAVLEVAFVSRPLHAWHDYRQLFFHTNENYFSPPEIGLTTNF